MFKSKEGNTRRISLEEAPGSSPADEQPVYEEIAKFAYELYQKRGKADGNDLEDWFEAEKILRERKRHRKF